MTTFLTLTAALFSAGPVAEFEGRFYIVAGEPGFNLPANNRNGYASEGEAREARAGVIRRAIKAERVRMGR